MHFIEKTEKDVFFILEIFQTVIIDAGLKYLVERSKPEKKLFLLHKVGSAPPVQILPVHTTQWHLSAIGAGLV